jgi:hypothetical protein
MFQIYAKRNIITLITVWAGFWIRNGGDENAKCEEYKCIRCNTLKTGQIPEYTLPGVAPSNVVVQTLAANVSLLQT